MTTTETKDKTRPTDTGGNDDGLTHVYCKACNPNPSAITAMCGKDVSNRPDIKGFRGNIPDTCLVCEDLWSHHRKTTHGIRP